MSDKILTEGNLRLKLGDTVWIAQTGRCPFILVEKTTYGHWYLRTPAGHIPNDVYPSGHSFHTAIHPSFLTDEKPPSSINWYISTGYVLLRILILTSLVIITLCASIISFIKLFCNL